MRIDIITVLPRYWIAHLITLSLEGKGERKKVLPKFIYTTFAIFQMINTGVLSDYSFGKGAGMVMAIQPIEKAIETLKSERNYDEIIFTTPDGNLLTRKQQTCFR